jgi:hypothetical protein
MIDPALWQAEGLTEGEDTVSAPYAAPPSTTACGRGPQCKVDHAPGMILDCRGQSNLALPLKRGRISSRNHPRPPAVDLLQRSNGG